MDQGVCVWRSGCLQGTINNRIQCVIRRWLGSELLHRLCICRSRWETNINYRHTSLLTACMFGQFASSCKHLFTIRITFTDLNGPLNKLTGSPAVLFLFPEVFVCSAPFFYSSHSRKRSIIRFTYTCTFLEPFSTFHRYVILYWTHHSQNNYYLELLHLPQMANTMYGLFTSLQNNWAYGRWKHPRISPNTRYFHILGAKSPKIVFIYIYRHIALKHWVQEVISGHYLPIKHDKWGRSIIDENLSSGL